VDRKPVLAILLVALAPAATRPRYGGVLRVEVRGVFETPGPPTSGHGIPDLAGAFALARWEAGRRTIYDANENAPGGRPFVDTIEILMGRSLRDQSNDLELGKADIVELGPAELRRQPAGRRVWSSAPVRLLVLVFGSRVEDVRIRQALALAVDRSSIHAALFQRMGEVSGALLPQWLSGYAFVFPTAVDTARARMLLAGVPAGARTLTLTTDDAALRPVAERIALNARDAGLTLAIPPQSAPAGENAVRLVEVRIGSADPGQALAGLASALGLPQPLRGDSPEALLRAERALIEGSRVIPLMHLPDVYGVSPRVKGGPGITPLGEWRFENLWLAESRAEGGRP